VADYAHNEQRLSEYVRATGIDLVEETGPARFVDPNTVAVGDGRSWQADRIIIAVGGHPGRLPIPGAELGLTYTDLRALTALPGGVAVIGGADTGCQLASILADFGCQVLVLEYAPRLTPRADQDISAALGAAFTRRGIEVVTGASAERLVRVDGGVEVHYRQADAPAHRLVDAVFFAVGWPANLAHILSRSLRKVYRWAAGRLQRWMGRRAARALGWWAWSSAPGWWPAACC
jgi:pyruvate/2-oxoglutarate dehydrogenase complex dihydrolipoamide dehydrogenase (E3) component